MDDDSTGSAREHLVAESGTVALLNRGEIDMQISTAKKWPRSIKRFRDEALQMVTLNEVIASECFYVLPRKKYDKVTRRYVDVSIEGPSARFAEIVLSAWGNCRAGARVVSDQGDYITAQGVFHDLERNVAITYEVQRRIVDAEGRRFSADMIGVTGNAASSIALRNAALKGVPKAFWADLQTAARECAMGDFKTLGTRRANAMQDLLRFGVQPTTVYSFLGIAGIDDISLDNLVTLRGILTSLREGDTTPERAFAMEGAEEPQASQAPAVPRKKADAPAPAPEPAVASEPAQAPTPAPAADAAPVQAAEPVAAPSPAPAPSPTPAPAPDEPAVAEGSPLASDGEKANIRVKARVKSLDLITVLDELGITSVKDPVTLEGLTQDDFAKLRRRLA
jgi:hypothetical protein